MKSHNVILAAGFAAMASSAFAQDAVSTVKSEENPHQKRYSAEIQPLDALASAIPGVSAAGASVEAMIGRQWAIDIGGSYASVDQIPTKFIGTTNDKTHTPLVDQGYGFTSGGGLRYYAEPIGSSVYGGLNLTYSDAHYGWGYKNETYTSRMQAVTPSLSAGYRWVWQNGVLARLGVGAGLPTLTQENVQAQTTGPDAVDGQRKIKDLMETKVVANIDVGLGMMF